MHGTNRNTAGIKYTTAPVRIDVCEKNRGKHAAWHANRNGAAPNGQRRRQPIVGMLARADVMRRWCGVWQTPMHHLHQAERR